MNIKTLLASLKKLVTDLSEDLLARSMANAEVDAGLREAYTQIEKGGRTADPFEGVHSRFAVPVFPYFSASQGCLIFGFSFDAHRLRVPSPVNAPIATVKLPHRL